VAGSYFHSHHSNTSSPINRNSLSRVIPSPDNFFFKDSSQVLIERQDTAFYQSYLLNGIKGLSYRFDIAFGSGEKAQTYASWQQDKFLQLPLTYFAVQKQWANSPGFPAQHARFSRVIESRCFECHASYIAKEIVPSGGLAVTEKLYPNSIIYGIDCERCHGPALDHVLFQQQHPDIKTAKHITSIRTLSRQQQLDMCAVCHSGNDETTQRSTFAFKPGDTLSKFYYPSFGAEPKDPDVHGKQMQLLRMSRCFRESQMTCGTCHSAHQDVPDNTAVIISKCVNCHQQSVHVSSMIESRSATRGQQTVATTSCLDCHMPLQSSRAISFSSSAGATTIPYLLRTHKIAVYGNYDSRPSRNATIKKSL
jgi:hypothetical protein